MSILINDMEFPTSCYKCPMRRRDGMDIVCPIAHERFSVTDVNILEYRLDSCPLIPIPPHGRCIDADALGYFPYNMDFCDGGEADEWVQNAPTIIPASEEVYDKYTDTAGNLHWTGTYSGEHIIQLEDGE